MKYKLLSIGLALLSAQCVIAQDLGSIASNLQSNTGNIIKIIGTITTWVSTLFGLVSLVRLIMIFTSQGSGEDKISKAGTWIFMLIFCVIGFTLAKTLFK